MKGHVNTKNGEISIENQVIAKYAGICVVPQIDNSHIDLRFGCWLTSDRNEGGGERHRGMTSGQHDPKQPHKNAKAPGRHEATRTHEMT